MIKVVSSLVLFCPNLFNSGPVLAAGTTQETVSSGVVCFFSKLNWAVCKDVTGAIYILSVLKIVSSGP